MKKIILLLLMVSLGSMPSLNLAAQGVHLARVEREAVAVLEAKVASDLAIDTLKKRLVFTAALIAGGYLTYLYVNPTAVEIPTAPASFDQLQLNNTLLQANNELLRQSLPEMQKAGSSSWLQESKIGKFGSWMWEIGKWSTQQAFIGYMANVLLMGSSSALGKMVKTIDGAVDSLSFNLFHDRDLKWFLISRARITNLFNELETHAYCIQTGMVGLPVDVREQEHTSGTTSAAGTSVAIQTPLALDEPSYAYHVTAFEQTWQQLSARVASLVAFIEHKAHACDQVSIQERLLLGAQHIVQLTNATAQQCENLLAQARLNALPTDILFEVRRLRSSVSDELMLANKLEHEVSW